MTIETLTSWSVDRRTLADTQRQMLQRWLRQHHDLSGTLLLNTCERVECYAHGPAPRAPRGVQVRWRRGSDAVGHVFRVAAGLDSRLVGETQIVGQMRRAIADAPSHTEALARLFRAAMRAGARTRSASGLDRHITSYARLAVRKATTSGDTVGVLGTGSLSRDVLRVLHRSRQHRVLLFGRHAARTEDIALEFGAEACPLPDIQRFAHRLHAAIVCYSAPQPLDLRTQRRGTGVIIDLGEPRNILLHDDDTTVLSLTDLSQARAPRADVIAVAEEITAQRATAYMHHATRSLRHQSHLVRGIGPLAAMTPTPLPAGVSA
jgi:glutamyl-tRNA reductase